MKRLNWGTNSDWSNASKTNINVVNDTFELAQTTAMIDGFEDQDYAEYNTVNSAYGFTTATSTEGSVAGEVSSSGGVNLYSQNGNGLSNYPSPGDTFRVDVNFDSSGNSMVGPCFAGTDTNNKYKVITRDNGDDLAFEKHESGSVTNIKKVSGVFNQDNWTGQWVTWETVWNSDNTFTFSLLDPLNSYNTIASFNASDSTYTTEGGFGTWHSNWGSNTSTVQFDNARIL